MADLNHGLAGPAVADAGAFLSRLVRVDAGALVRLRPAGRGRLALWAHLPWRVLVTRTLPGSVPADATVPARALLAALAAGSTALPPRCDARWLWPLPGGAAVVEQVPAARIRELGSAAEHAVRAALAGGGRVGERVVRDAFLDHVAIAVEPDVAGATVTSATVTSATVTSATVTGATSDRDSGRNVRIEVPQRLVQAVVRMGFLRRVASDDEPTVRVLHSGRFVGLGAEYGVAWYRSGDTLSARLLH